MRLQTASFLFYGEVVASLGPVGDERVDDHVADTVGGVERGQIGAVLANFSFRDAFCGGDADALLVVVGCGAQNEDAIDVELACFGQPEIGRASCRERVCR